MCVCVGEGARAETENLVDCETGINSSTIDLFALNIESPHRRTHSLGAHSNDTDVLWKIKSR